MADISRRWSPYTYANNNPIRFIDPDGMSSSEFLSSWMDRKAAEDVHRGENQTSEDAYNRIQGLQSSSLVQEQNTQLGSQEDEKSSTDNSTKPDDRNNNSVHPDERNDNRLWSYISGDPGPKKKKTTSAHEKVKEVTVPAGAISETAAVITHTGQLMDEAAEVTTGAKGVGVAAKALGGLAGGIGMVNAGMDMAQNGMGVKNTTQMVLSTVTFLSAFFPVLAPVAIAAGIINLAIEYGTHH